PVTVPVRESSAPPPTEVVEPGGQPRLSSTTPDLSPEREPVLESQPSEIGGGPKPTDLASQSPTASSHHSAEPDVRPSVPHPHSDIPPDQRGVTPGGHDG